MLVPVLAVPPLVVPAVVVPVVVVAWLVVPELLVDAGLDVLELLVVLVAGRFGYTGLLQQPARVGVRPASAGRCRP